MAKQSVNGKFSKPTSCFSQVENDILRDPNLSLKAKGLYSLIVSYITLPNFTLYKGYLQSQCAEGRHAFDSTWKELAAAGYLEHTRIRQPDGTFAYEYSLLSLEKESKTKKSTKASNTPTLEKESKTKKSTKASSTPTLEKECQTKKSTKASNTPTLEKECQTKKSTKASNTPTLEKECQTKKSTKASKYLPCINKYSESDFSLSKHPLAENQTSASYIENKTLSKNTQSITNLTALEKQIANKIDLAYFQSEPFYSGEKQMVLQSLYQYLCQMAESLVTQQPMKNITATQCELVLQHSSSCMMSEFLLHMKNVVTGPITYPIPYWRKAFVNYVEESAYALVAAGN